MKFEQVEVGQDLPELSVEITTKLVVSTAMATRDYQDVHHDVDRARELGSENIFMNILTTNGFVGRFVTDWAGPEALVKNIAIRLGVPNYPGDTMQMTGSVTSKELVDGEGVVEVAVRGANSMGDHVTGTARVVLPTSEDGAA